jgi:hypothetical protein
VNDVDHEDTDKLRADSQIPGLLPSDDSYAALGPGERLVFELQGGIQATAQMDRRSPKSSLMGQMGVARYEHATLSPIGS